MHLTENSPAAQPEIMAKLWLTRHQNASESLTIQALGDTAKWLSNLKFTDYFGKILVG
jgi:hypothetical protein